MVVWRTIQCQSLSGTARNQTLTPPMIISSSPPEANSFRPVSILFKDSNIFLFSNRHETGVFHGQKCPHQFLPGNQRSRHICSAI